MAIVVLVLWMLTAGAGFYLLVTSNLGRARPADAIMPAKRAATGERATTSVTAAAAAQAANSQAAHTAHTAHTARSARSAHSAPAAPAAPAGSSDQSVTPASTVPPISKREIRRAARDRFDPPSLTAAKAAPIVPGLRSLVEFAHPACAIVGLGFWLGYTFVHYRALGWIAFALVSVTACLGLGWFMANARAAGHQNGTSGHDAAGRRPEDEPRPSFSSRLIALHGGAAAVTFSLAALTILALGR